MSLSPTIGISELSLESIPPTARLMQKMDLSREEDEGRAPQGEADDSADDDNDTRIRSPSKLKYNIERLSPDAQKSIRSLWGHIPEEPPEISLQWCDRMLDVDGNDFYAFQMHEVVPRSVRIGSQKSQYSVPQCQCGAPKPCKHLIWLSDYIAQQALYDHDPRAPLNLNEQGYPDELGDPFQCISDMRLAVLADGLHCAIGHPLARTGPSPQTIADAQAIIASVADVDEHVFDSYRSDLAQGPFDSGSLVHHRDPEATLFSLLVASHRLSAWVRSLLRPSDPARSPFRQIESRARRIFTDFDNFLASSTTITTSASASLLPASAPGNPTAGDPDPEGPCDVRWAATSLTRCTRQIHILVSRAEAPLPPAERANAARALVRILRGVVERHRDPVEVGNNNNNNEDDDGGGQGRSLYSRLIGDRDDGFAVAATLGLLVDQSQFVDEIEDIMAEVGRRGAAASWVAEMEAVVARMRGGRRAGGAGAAAARRDGGGGGGGRVGGTAAAAAGDAGGRAEEDRQRSRTGRRRRREESPALGPVEHGAPGSASASGVGIGASGGSVGLGIGYGAGSVSGAGPSAGTTASGSGVEFPAPGTPAAGPSSSRGRGGGRVSRGSSSGGAGSKRSGAGRPASERGSKRAR